MTDKSSRIDSRFEIHERQYINEPDKTHFVLLAMDTSSSAQVIKSFARKIQRIDITSQCVSLALVGMLILVCSAVDFRTTSAQVKHMITKLPANVPIVAL